MFANRYAGQTVLITGHTGFKGAWLAHWLKQLGAKVVGYALPPPTVPSVFETSRLDRQIESIEGDVRDVAHVAEVIRRHRPAYIFHLAAASLVRESYANPLDTFSVNVMGTLSVLEALRSQAYPCVIVVITSDKCYENKEWEYGYRETDSLGGHDPYSASKAALEIAVASYRRSFFPIEKDAQHGVRLATARAGNVIGGGDWAVDRIVPDAMRSLARKEDLIVRNPRAVRPWQHVLEPLSGYLWLGAKLASTDGENLAASWNFGPIPTQLYTVAELADALVKEWGDGEWRAVENQNTQYEAGLLKLAIDKAQMHLGWEPVWDFATTVKRTVAWYRSFYTASADAQTVSANCLADITDYEATARARELRWTS